MNDILKEIDRQSQFTEADRQEMEKLISNLQQKCAEIHLNLSFDRWITVGVHLINMLRRRGSNGTLPAIEDSMWDQISPEMKAFSEHALEAYRGDFEPAHFLGEVFLLAVHFETAKLLD